MFHLKQRMKCLEDSAGQGLVEYAVILLFVAIAVVVAVLLSARRSGPITSTLSTRSRFSESFLPG